MVIRVVVLVGQPAILPSSRVLIESGVKVGGKHIRSSRLFITRTIKCCGESTLPSLHPLVAIQDRRWLSSMSSTVVTSYSDWMHRMSGSG